MKTWQAICQALLIIGMISDIRAKIAKGLFEFSKHAVDQSILRRITVEEIREAFTTAEIIEDYPDDNRGPSCLILGYTESERPIHIHCSYPSRTIIKIITIYEPDQNQWIDNKIRKD